MQHADHDNDDGTVSVSICLNEGEVMTGPERDRHEGSWVVDSVIIFYFVSIVNQFRCYFVIIIVVCATIIYTVLCINHVFHAV